MSETFVPLTVGDVAPDRFNGFIRADWIGRLMVAELASAAQDIQRTNRLISQADAEYFQVGLVARGLALIEQDDREAVLRPGGCAVYETTRRFRWTFGDDWGAWVFTVPRASVGLTEAESRRLTARPAGWPERRHGGRVKVSARPGPQFRRPVRVEVGARPGRCHRPCADAVERLGR